MIRATKVFQHSLFHWGVGRGCYWSSSTIFWATLPNQAQHHSSQPPSIGTQIALLIKSTPLCFSLAWIIPLQRQQEKFERRTDLYCLLALCWFAELVEKKVQVHDANQVDVFELPQSPTWTIIQHAKPLSPTMLLPLFLIYITPRTHFWAAATVDFLLMCNNPDKVC